MSSDSSSVESSEDVSSPLIVSDKELTDTKKEMYDEFVEAKIIIPFKGKYQINPEYYRKTNDGKIIKSDGKPNIDWLAIGSKLRISQENLPKYRNMFYAASSLGPYSEAFKAKYKSQRKKVIKPLANPQEDLIKKMFEEMESLKAQVVTLNKKRLRDEDSDVKRLYESLRKSQSIKNGNSLPPLATLLMPPAPLDSLPRGPSAELKEELTKAESYLGECLVERIDKSQTKTESDLVNDMACTIKFKLPSDVDQMEELLIKMARHLGQLITDNNFTLDKLQTINLSLNNESLFSVLFVIVK